MKAETQAQHSQQTTPSYPTPPPPPRPCARTVAFAQQSGSHALIDVRPAGLYAQGRLDGAANVEYYRPIQGWSPWQVARRIGYAAFGVLNGTEVNPDFAAEVAAAVGGDKSRPVLLYCSQGGALEGGSAGAAKRGFQTRWVWGCALLGGGGRGRGREGGRQGEQGRGKRPAAPTQLMGPTQRNRHHANAGHAIDSHPPFERRLCRSLVAAYELVQSGFTSVAILKGGYFGWEAAGREVVGANDGGAGEEEEEGGAVAGN